MKNIVKAVEGETLRPGQPVTSDGNGRLRAWRTGDVLVGRTATEEETAGLPPAPAGHVYLAYYTAAVMTDAQGPAPTEPEAP